MDASNMSHGEYFRLHGHLSVERQRQLIDDVRAEVDRVCEVMKGVANGSDVSDSLSDILKDAIIRLREM